MSSNRNLKKHPEGYTYDDSDPFSDQSVQLVETQAGIQIRGRGWMSTTFFPDERRAHHWLSSRGGEAAPFPFSAIEVGKTPDEKEDLAQDPIDGIDKGIDEARDFLDDV